MMHDGALYEVFSTSAGLVFHNPFTKYQLYLSRTFVGFLFWFIFLPIGEQFHNRQVQSITLT